MGRKNVSNDKEGQQQKPIETPKEQYMIVELAESRPGMLELVIPESTFINPQVAVFALEIADNIIIKGMEGDNHRIEHKHKPGNNENMGIKVQYLLKAYRFDRVSIVYSSFTCDAFAIMALRLATQFITMQLQDAMKSRIALPGEGGMPQVPGGGKT